MTRPVSSVTWRVFDTPSKIVDAAYDVTLSFPLAEKLTASRTFSCELRTASFAPHVRACETNSAAWRKFELPAVFPFDASWFRGVSYITYIQWKNLEDNTAYGPPPSGSGFQKTKGFLVVPDGYLPKAVYLASIHQWNTRLAQCEISNVTGVLIIFR